LTDYVRVHGRLQVMPMINGVMQRDKMIHIKEMDRNDKIIGEYDPDRKVIHPIADEARAVVGKKGQTLDSLLFGGK